MGHFARVGEIRNVLVGNHEGKRAFERWEDRPNIKIK
jgi:hypothetical protein